MKDFYIDDSGIRLHCRLDQPGNSTRCPLLIIIHGLTGHMEEEHLSALSEAAGDNGFAVLRAEMYGHGQSGGLFADHTIGKWLENVQAVTAYAKSLDFVSGLYLAGHSQGGLVSAMAAGIRPQDYQALVLLSPSLNIPEDARQGNFLNAFRFDPDHIPVSFVWNGKKLQGDYLRDAQGICTEEYIRRYRKPVLIIHGDRDEVIPVSVSAKAAEQYSDCRLITVAGDDHDYHCHADIMTDAAVRFLQENRHESGTF